MSVRRMDFNLFSQIVEAHIDNYTVPQYGDRPNDEIEHWTVDQCIKAIQKYAKRYESSRRGRIETLRDMVKIAHFAQLTFNKFHPTPEEIYAIKEGTR